MCSHKYVWYIYIWHKIETPARTWFGNGNVVAAIGGRHTGVVGLNSCIFDFLELQCNLIHFLGKKARFCSLVTWELASIVSKEKPLGCPSSRKNIYSLSSSRLFCFDVSSYRFHVIISWNIIWLNSPTYLSGSPWRLSTPCTECSRSPLPKCFDRAGNIDMITWLTSNLVTCRMQMEYLNRHGQKELYIYMYIIFATETHCWLLRWLSFRFPKLNVSILPTQPVWYCRQQLSRGLQVSDYQNWAKTYTI